MRQGPWWGWSDTKWALELLFRTGELVSAGRRGFERRYGLPEQVLGGPIETVPKPEAIRELVRRAAVAHGVAALPDLADYYRLRSDDTAVAAQELEDAGELVPVTRAGLGRAPTAGRSRSGGTSTRRRPTRMRDGRGAVAVRPRRVAAGPGAADVRLPLPDLDLHARGAAGARLLRAAGARRRPTRRPRRPEVRPADRPPPGAGGVDGAERASGVAERLAPVLRDAARWQGLDTIEVVGAGDLAPALAASWLERAAPDPAG